MNRLQRHLARSTLEDRILGAILAAFTTQLGMLLVIALVI